MARLSDQGETRAADLPGDSAFGRDEHLAKIANASDPDTDLDLFWFDCHTGSCVQRASSAGGTAEGSVSVNNTAPGT